MPKTSKIVRRKPAPQFSVLCAVGALDHEGPKRLEQAMAVLRAAKLTAEWILVDAGEGLAETMAARPALKKAGAKAISAESALQDWGRYCLAASSATGTYCLCLPAGCSLDAGTFKAMVAAVKNADFVVLQGGGMPTWILKLQHWFWSIPGVDLGAPVVIRRDFFSALSAGERPAAAFLGSSLIRKAILNGSRGALCKAPAPSSKREPLSYMGDDLGLGAYARRLAPAPIGILLAWIGYALIGQVSAALGVSLVATGSILLGMVFGKE
jgi:hypothetical protein